MQFDTEVCEDATLKDISIKKVQWYLREREKARKISRKIKISHEELLTNLKCLKGKKPTNAGILFFGKYPPRFHANARLMAVKFKGNDITNPTLDSITCEGTLPEMVELVEDFIRKNIRLLGTRTNKSFRREDKFEYPIKVIREAVINALIHRSYYETGDVRVFIFDNRIQIMNPGTFPQGVTPDKPEHKPVNEVLCQLFYDIGLIEKYGSGIPMMKLLSKEWENKPPYYDLHPVATKIIFESQIKESTYIKEKVVAEFNERQKMFIKSNKKNISRSEYVKLTNCSIRTAVNDLQDLLDKKVVKKASRGRYTRYVLI